ASAGFLDVLEDDTARVLARRHEPVPQRLAVIRAAKDSTAVPAPGDVLPGVSLQFLASYFAAILHMLSVEPGDITVIGGHGLPPTEGGRGTLGSLYPTAFSSLDHPRSGVPVCLQLRRGGLVPGTQAYAAKSVTPSARRKSSSSSACPVSTA